MRVHFSGALSLLLLVLFMLALLLNLVPREGVMRVESVGHAQGRAADAASSSISRAASETGAWAATSAATLRAAAR